jgi:hypothetical protein
MGKSGYRGFVGVLIAGSMVFSSTGAIAATSTPSTQVDPWAVLSVMSGGASAVAVCGAAAAAAVAAQPASGCVLPQVDAAAPAASQGPPPEPIPVPPVEAAGGGLGISPLIIALGVLAVGVGAYLILHKSNHHANSPA